LGGHWTTRNHGLKADTSKMSQALARRHERHRGVGPVVAMVIVDFVAARERASARMNA
jgi:hypothetical protein